MTEEEARTKWCPMMRFNYCGDSTTDDNRGGHKNKLNVVNCIASQCMMWRPTDNECIPMTYEQSRNNDGPHCFPAGYCGLGGKP